MSDNEGSVDELVALMKDIRIAMLTTVDGEGHLTARPMAQQEVEFDGDLWFFVYDDSDKARQIGLNPKVNVSFANDQKSEWTSIAGTAEIVHDRAKAEELWAKPLETWFPDGLETPGLALIKVHADSAEYWDAADSKVKQLLGMRKAIKNDDPDEFPSENRTVEL